MTPRIATIIYIAGIVGLFWLDRERNARPSKALWIPVVWLLINGSRPVSLWLDMAPVMDSPEKYLDGSPLDAFVFGSLLAAGVIVLVRRGRQVGRIFRANIPLLLFLSYCALSTLWSDYTFVASKRWIKSLGDVVMVLVILTDPEPVPALKRLLARVGFVLIPFSILFIKYYPEMGRGYNIWTWMPSYTGVTTGKNLLGMICMVFGLGSVWCFLSAYEQKKGTERTRRMIAHGAFIGMVCWLFWMANSMTSLSCFILVGGLISMTCIFRAARRPSVILLLVALVICASFSTLFLGVGGGALETMGRDSTLTGRTEIWAIVIRLVTNPLFGTGFESFWLGDRLQKVWDTYVGTQIQEAHNGYLEVYLNLGWVGIILMANLIVNGYQNIIDLFRRDPDAGRIRLAWFVAAILYNLTEAGFRMMSPIWFGFLLAITAAPAVLDRKVRSQPALSDSPRLPLSASRVLAPILFAESRKEITNK